MAEAKSASLISPGMLSQIKDLSGNHQCCDCASSDTGWGSVTHGTLLCLSCAGTHRSMGVNVSFVKSLHMDSWTADQVEMMRQGGNAKIRSFFAQLSLETLPANQLYKSTGAAHYRKALRQRTNYVLSGEHGEAPPFCVPTGAVSNVESPETETETETATAAGESKLSRGSGDAARATDSPNKSSGNGNGNGTDTGGLGDRRSSSRLFNLRFDYGPLGFALQPDTPTPGRTNKAMVSLVLPGQQAASLGLKPRDIVTSVAGTPCRGYEDATQLISSSSRPVQITFLRVQQAIWAPPPHVTATATKAPLTLSDMVGDLTPTTAAQRDPGFVTPPSVSVSASVSDHRVGEDIEAAKSHETRKHSQADAECKKASSCAHKPLHPGSGSPNGQGSEGRASRGTRERTASGGFITRPPALQMQGSDNTGAIPAAATDTNSPELEPRTSSRAETRPTSAKTAATPEATALSRKRGDTSKKASGGTPVTPRDKHGSATKSRRSSSGDADGSPSSLSLLRPKSPSSTSKLSVFQRLTADADARADRRNSKDGYISSPRTLSGEGGAGALDLSHLRQRAASDEHIISPRVRGASPDSPSPTPSPVQASSGRRSPSLAGLSKDGKQSTPPSNSQEKATVAAAAASSAGSVARESLDERPRLCRSSSGSIPVEFRVLFSKAPLGITITRNAGNGTADITRLAPSGHAECMGVRIGDTIVGIDNHWLGSYDEVMQYLPSRPFPYAIVFRRGLTSPRGSSQELSSLR